MVINSKARIERTRGYVNHNDALRCFSGDVRLSGYNMTSNLINIHNYDDSCFLHYIILVKFFSKINQHGKYKHRSWRTYDFSNDINKSGKFYIAMLPFIKFPKSYKEFNVVSENILNQYYSNKNTNQITLLVYSELSKLNQVIQ